MACLSESFHNIKLKNYSQQYFITYFSINSLHKSFLLAEGVLIVTRMQPSTTMYVPNDKEMAGHHSYLQIDCGFFFICQDAN